MTRPKTHRYIALMQWRNQILAVLCLLAFAWLGVLYFRHWVVQKPFGIILFVGEGLAPHQLAAARVFAGGAEAKLSLDSMKHSALLTNYSKDFATPDQAAAATAIATGVKVPNRAIAVDSDGKPLATLLELARERGRATGLITDARLTDSTSAAFYAHPTNGSDSEEIARQFCEKTRIDVTMGGGEVQFVPQDKGGQRQDGRDLLLELRRNGLEVIHTRAELESIPAWRRSRLFAIFARDEMAFPNQIDERKEQPSLSDMVRRGVELLQYNAGGYLLVVDGGLMRKAAQDNNAERTLSEILEFDRAIATARRYAGPKSTVVVCGDVAIGGLTLNGFPFRKDSGIALLGLNSGGQPWITWATGPNGNRSYGPGKLPPKNETGETNEPESASAPERLEPAAVFAKTALNTVDDVIAFGTGPGTEVLQGCLDNTAVFKLLRDEL